MIINSQNQRTACRHIKSKAHAISFIRPLATSPHFLTFASFVYDRRLQQKPTLLLLLTNRFSSWKTLWPRNYFLSDMNWTGNSCTLRKKSSWCELQQYNTKFWRSQHILRISPLQGITFFGRFLMCSLKSGLMNFSCQNPVIYIL